MLGFKKHFKLIDWTGEADGFGTALMDFETFSESSVKTRVSGSIRH